MGSRWYYQQRYPHLLSIRASENGLADDETAARARAPLRVSTDISKHWRRRGSFEATAAAGCVVSTFRRTDDAHQGFGRVACTTGRPLRIALRAGFRFEEGVITVCDLDAAGV